MADNENPTGAGSFMSVTMGDDGPEVKKGTQDGLSPDDVADVDDDLPSDDEQSAATEDDAGGDGPEADTAEGDEEGSDVEDLGDFDPENVEQWDAKYRDESGSFREDLLSAEFDANEGQGLNEATYDYLEAQGFKKDFVKDIEAALVTKRDAALSSADETTMALMTKAGGPDKLKKALDWGKTGGYDKASQERFNKVMSGDDPVAKQEAVELLMARFKSADPEAVGEEKPQKPRRDATKGRGGPSKSSLKPFKNQKEYREALAEAGDNHEKIKQVTARRRASSL
jgi:hypothetical protein